MLVLAIKARIDTKTYPYNQRFPLSLEPCLPQVYRQPIPNRIFVRDRDHRVECFLVYSPDRRSLACVDAPDRIISDQKSEKDALELSKQY